MDCKLYQDTKGSKLIDLFVLVVYPASSQSFCVFPVTLSEQTFLEQRTSPGLFLLLYRTVFKVGLPFERLFCQRCVSKLDRM